MHNSLDKLRNMSIDVHYYMQDYVCVLYFGFV